MALIYVVEKQEDAYGEQGTTDKIGKIDGAYHPKSRIVVLVASSFHNSLEARQTLRHEILGHYCLNTFSPSEKLDILKKIINSKKALNDEWAKIDELYADNKANLHEPLKTDDLVRKEMVRSEKAVLFLFTVTDRHFFIAYKNLTFLELGDTMVTRFVF